MPVMRPATYMYNTWVNLFGCIYFVDKFNKPGLWNTIYLLRKMALQKQSTLQKLNVNSFWLMSNECGVSINYGSPFPWDVKLACNQSKFKETNIRSPKNCKFLKWKTFWIKFNFFLGLVRLTYENLVKLVFLF